MFATAPQDADDISLSRSLRDTGGGGGGDDDVKAMLRHIMEKLRSLEAKVAAVADE